MTPATPKAEKKTKDATERVDGTAAGEEEGEEEEIKFSQSKRLDSEMDEDRTKSEEDHLEKVIIMI